MKNVIKKITMLSMLSCIAGNTSLLMSSQKPTMNDEQKASLQEQVDSFSQQFATLANDAKLNDQLKAQYKDLTTEINSYVSNNKKLNSQQNKNRNRDKERELSDKMTEFINDLNDDQQYKIYIKNPQNATTIAQLKSSLKWLQHIAWDYQMEQMEQMEQPRPTSRPNNLMKEPTDEKPVKVQVKVINVPTDHFIAAGVLDHDHGKTNYSIQKPNADGIYTFSSNHYYAAAANDRKSFMNQHEGSDFIGKTTWDVKNNKIS